MVQNQQVGTCFNFVLAVPPITLPKPPTFALPTLFPFPIAGQVPCCRIALKITGLDQTIQAANAAIASLTSTLSIEIMAAQLVINTSEAIINKALNQYGVTIPNCPVNGKNYSTNLG